MTPAGRQLASAPDLASPAPVRAPVLRVLPGTPQAVSAARQIARQLDPTNTSVYSHLATAYRQRGQLDQAQKMVAILANLNEAQAAKIRSGPGEHTVTTAPSRVE